MNDIVFYIKGFTRETSLYRPWYKSTVHMHYSGTGVYIEIDDKPFLLTNYHVVDEAEIITVYDKTKPYNGVFVFGMPELDLALITVPDKVYEKKQPAKIGTTPAAGDTVTSYGYSLGMHNVTAAKHTIMNITTNTYYEFSTSLAIIIDGTINQGDSGGPVFLGSEIIGLVQSSYTEASSGGTHNIIPSILIRFFIDAFRNGNNIFYKPIHIQQDLYPAHKKYIGAEDEDGVLIIKDSGQLKCRDFLFKINGYPVSSNGLVSMKIIKDIYEPGSPSGLLDKAMISYKYIMGIIPDSVDIKFQVIRDKKKISLVDRTRKYHPLIDYNCRGSLYEYVQIADITFVTPYLTGYHFDANETHKDVYVQMLEDHWNIERPRVGYSLVMHGHSMRNIPYCAILDNYNGIKIENLRHLYEVHKKNDTGLIILQFKYPHFTEFVIDKDDEDISYLPEAHFNKNEYPGRGINYEKYV